MEFLKRLEEIDPDLAAQARREIADKETAERVTRARRNLADTIGQFSDDATGQDGEAEIESAAADYCDAQSDRIKRMDPERWSEMRFCGLL